MSRSSIAILCLSVLCPRLLHASEPAGAAGWHSTELRRFKAPEANQGVAVDAVHFYAIANAEIGKYRKENGQRVAGWKAAKDEGIQHLNAGIVLDGKLYCAHSNFPAMPEESSVEIFDTATMTHVGRHKFDQPPGSLTWTVPRGRDWFACFAHYRKTSDPALSRVVKFDSGWRQLTSWSFPPALIQKFGASSSSGGAFGPGGHLFVTGHDARELYVLDLPSSGTELVWLATIPVPTAGQAFAWDPVDEALLNSIERKSREVVVSWIDRPENRTEPASFRPTRCDGFYPRHVQGITTDGQGAIFWSWTEALVKTDLRGRVLKEVKAADHHGDLCFSEGKVYVAVNLGQFNEPPGKENSWVYVYDAATLAEVARHPVPELVHGAGGITCRDGKFLVVGGLPPGVPENYLYEYDASFKFLERHVLASGHTDKGIQTAAWIDRAWWFGCYGTPRILLRADEQFRLTGRWEFDASYGLDALPDGRILVGRNVNLKGTGNAGRLVIGRADPVKGVRLED